MLYSILSQINKGLRRIDILRKSEMRISQQGSGRFLLPEESVFSLPVQGSTGNDPSLEIIWFILKRAFFISHSGISNITKKTPAEFEYECFPSINSGAPRSR